MLSTSSEPSFFIDDMSQSPFNIGQNVEIANFSKDEIGIFMDNFALEATPKDIQRIFDFVGGRPILVHTILYHLVCKSASESQLFNAINAGNSVFHNHLNGYLLHFQRDPKLLAAMKNILAGKSCEDLQLLDRLVAAGLLNYVNAENPQPSCRLYAEFFKNALS